MERLTTNKDKSEMGMYELAHNSCYYKDGSARYRDFESDIDARDFTRRLLKNFADGDDSFIDDEDFDEEMLELLQYGTETIEGLIALFYRNLWAMADLRECLKEYEDLEEQGLKNEYSSSWILCSERLPEEHDSWFVKFKGTDKWNESMFEKTSYDVNATVEFNDGTRRTMMLHTIDGKWNKRNRIIDFKVIAWQPLPEPYNE